MAIAARPSAHDAALHAYGARGRSPWLGVDWREDRRWIEVAGPTVNVVELGEGDPIVFIHGLAGSWQNWLEQLPVFARSHRAIAFDLPGFGQSPMPRGKIAIAGYGRLVEALLTALEVPRAVLVGNSMGGFIAAEVAIQFPARVQRLVLVSAAGLTVEHQRDERALAVLKYLEARLTAWGGWVGARADDLAQRRRYRRALMALVVAHRSPACGARAGAAARLGQARVRGRARRADRLPDPRSPGPDLVSDAHRLGRQRRPYPGRRRGGGRAADPGLPPRRLRRHRQPGDARAPRRVQRAAGEVHGRGGRRAARRPWRGAGPGADPAAAVTALR